MNYKNRPKINPKIIFNNILPNTRSALIIGENNSDIFEIFRSKKITVEEFKIRDEKEILKYLNGQDDKQFSIIVFNFELSNYNRLNLIIPTLIKKSDYCVIRFRNHNNGVKLTKKKRIHAILKRENISILKKFYGRKNRVSASILFKPFAYYTAYFIRKDEIPLNYEPLLVDKIKGLLSPKKEAIKLLINKEQKYGK